MPNLDGAIRHGNLSCMFEGGRRVVLALFWVLLYRHARIVGGVLKRILPIPPMSKLSIIPCGDKSLLVTCDFRASSQSLFDAHTQSALIQKWLLGPPG